MTVEFKTNYRGRPIDTLTREELIEALDHCANLLYKNLNTNYELNFSHITRTKPDGVIPFPAGYCTNCGTYRDKSLKCSGCGWIDPPTTQEKPKEGKE